MSFTPLALRAQRYRFRIPLNPLQQLGTRTYKSTERTRTIADLLDFKPPEPVPDTTANGWVRSVRAQKQHHFVSIGDGSSLVPIQAVVPPDQAEGWDI